MHLILADDTPAGKILHHELVQAGRPVTLHLPDDLPGALTLQGHCVLLRASRTASLIRHIEAVRLANGDTTLIVALTVSEQMFGDALALYNAGADAVLPPAFDTQSIHQLLEHLIFLATLQGRDAEGRRSLRREPDLAAALLGTVQTHVEAASLLFDRFRMRVSASSGALYEVTVDGGAPIAAQRFDSGSPACSVDELLQIDRGCYLIYAALDDDAITGVVPELAVVA